LHLSGKTIIDKEGIAVIKNLLWFCEGALFSTNPAMTYAVSQSLNDLGVSAALNVIDGQIRRSLEYCLESMAQRYKLHYEDLYGRFLQHYRSIPIANQPAFEFTSQICAHISRQGGKNIALTQCNCTPVKELLAFNNLLDNFSGLIQTQRSQKHSESEEIYDLYQSVACALENFNLEKATTLVVASQEVEIQTARQLGLRTCQVGRSPGDPSSDFQVDNHAQLFALLQQQSTSDNPKGDRE
jgi:phosphoglycolate phosphatase-like HAD superfamily hydrolase